MRSYLDGNDKKNEIRLLFRHPLHKNKVIVILEGKTDVKLFRSLLNSQYISLETFDGKNSLVEIMNEMVFEYPNRLFAICDADFLHLGAEYDIYERNSVFLTDYHDVEMMLFCSRSLDNYVNEYSLPEVVDFMKNYLYENAMEAAYFIGIIRWLNDIEDLGLRFEGLNFRSFIDIDRTGITVSEEDLIDEILRRSNNLESHVSASFLMGRISELRAEARDQLQVNCGHDVTKIVSMVYQGSWVSSERNMDQRKVESALRIGYQVSDFIQTELFRKLNSAFVKSGLAASIC
ncbi:DUF4435 domain-containing protein [Saccharospirillum alexandrii]|uniref:DUF4435 domain-containing protein n=1 Tax=Saccharospirillum alexandrii TaxID=2448477 RepID=UPI0013DF9279|nr:DUF4435 domain-containing protein [Saccharospirillum alexandrii]